MKVEVEVEPVMAVDINHHGSELYSIQGTEYVPSCFGPVVALWKISQSHYIRVRKGYEGDDSARTR